jgi:hypothetical protein
VNRFSCADTTSKIGQPRGGCGIDGRSTLPDGGEIPRIAALRQIRSARIRAVADLLHTVSQGGNILEVDDLVFLFTL